CSAEAGALARPQAGRAAARVGALDTWNQHRAAGRARSGYGPPDPRPGEGAHADRQERGLHASPEPRRRPRAVTESAHEPGRIMPVIYRTAGAWGPGKGANLEDRKSTRLNSSH